MCFQTCRRADDAMFGLAIFLSVGQLNRVRGRWVRLRTCADEASSVAPDCPEWLHPRQELYVLKNWVIGVLTSDKRQIRRSRQIGRAHV